MRDIKEAIQKHFTDSEIREWYESDIVDELYKLEPRFQWTVETKIFKAIEKLKSELDK